MLEKTNNNNCYIPRKITAEELLDDDEFIMSLIIPGQPATKKTSQRIFRKRILPSKAYCDYEKHCEVFCKTAWINKGKLPIDFGVKINMKVYLKNWIVGDCTGYQQSIADILQKHEVLSNDSWIHWDWENEHWLAGIDKSSPRVELTIKRFRHPKEKYREEQELALKQKDERKQVKLKNLAKDNNE